jgi:hypothetical protein
MTNSGESGSPTVCYMSRHFPSNLPHALSSFIGRGHEINEIKQLFSSTRLLTLTGPGGCGKTRLGLWVAAELGPSFRDGVWLAELAPLTDPELVTQAVCTAVGMREQPGLPLIAVLADFLQSREMLLVLDNCEHLIAACAQLAETLLRTPPAQGSSHKPGSPVYRWRACLARASLVCAGAPVAR